MRSYVVKFFFPTLPGVPGIHSIVSRVDHPDRGSAELWAAEEKVRLGASHATVRLARIDKGRRRR